MLVVTGKLAESSAFFSWIFTLACVPPHSDPAIWSRYEAANLLVKSPKAHTLASHIVDVCGISPQISGFMIPHQPRPLSTAVATPLRLQQVKMADLPKLRQDLESNEDVIGCLQILNALLVTDISVATVSGVLTTIPLGVIFSCLETDDPDQLSLTCALLEKLLCHLQASELVQYSHFVELGLQYPRAKVVKTCLQALLHLCGEEAVQEMILAPTMLHLVTQLLGADDLQCASLATKMLLYFSSQYPILEGKLANEVWLCELNSLLQGQDIVRYRVYDLLVQTCLQGGDKCFLTVSNTGYLDRLVRELDTSDPLVKINCIELLSTLIDSPRGLSFLQCSNVLENVYQTLLRSEQDVMETIVIPSRFNVHN